MLPESEGVSAEGKRLMNWTKLSSITAATKPHHRDRLQPVGRVPEMCRQPRVVLPAVRKRVLACHGFRQGMASLAVSAGNKVKVVQQMLGHETAGIGI